MEWVLEGGGEEGDADKENRPRGGKKDDDLLREKKKKKNEIQTHLQVPTDIYRSIITISHEGPNPRTLTHETLP